MNKYNIFNPPSRLFKYYSFDNKLNVKRLSGEVFLATPFDFNDPCDCQRDVKNNSSDRVAVKGPGWLRVKMLELDYNKHDSEEVAKSLLKDDSMVKQVHKRMLDRLGILCLTQTHCDTLMWGYYANNEGMCIEYDVNKLAHNLTIGFVNKMSYTTTRFLYETEGYSNSPNLRTPSLNTGCIAYANDLFKKNDLKQIKNKYLEETTNDDSLKLHFIKNVFLKRIYAKSIIYNVSPVESPSPLFFQRGNIESESKYFKKTKTWEHEEEFRFIVSLGGKLVIPLGEECIKNVYLGCNMSNEKIASVVYLMAKNNLSAGLYKMKRNKNGGLGPTGIKWETYKGSINNFKDELEKLFPEQ